jgi:prephenate dehydrogenase
MNKKPYFDVAAIFGVGLIGGSIARVLKNRKLAGKVVGVGRGGLNLKTALELGILDEIAQPEKAAAEADLIIICTPVLSIVPTLEKIAPHVKNGALVTDAGSTKKEIVENGERIAGEKFFFVGSHPIAGTEKSGAQSSFETLFENRKCVITPTAATSPEKLGLVENLWRSAGMEVVTMDPGEHDGIFAAISHLPHMVAYALVNVMCDLPNGEKLLGFAGGGFRDTTRIASSPPEMWADVALANSEAITLMIEKMTGRLGEIESAIKAGDREKLLAFFEKANRFREKLR